MELTQDGNGSAGKGSRFLGAKVLGPLDPTIVVPVSQLE